MISADDRELRALSADLASVTRKTLGTMREVYQEGAERLTAEWRANATETAGAHGRFYPQSITAEERFSTGLHWEIGPDKSKKQGGMGLGFEYGSIHQSPHMDGNRAADKLGPVVERMIALAAEDLF